MRYSRAWSALILVIALFALTGCATDPKNPDPYEKTNRFFFGVNETLDKFILKPATDLYVAVIPRPVRTGVTNAFDNLGYGNVIVNDLLQGKFDQAFRDTGRMAVNTTVGIAGVFDVATGWNLPA